MSTNEEIALELGWTDIKDGMFADPVGTPPPGSDKTLFMTVALGGGRYYLPDFEHDWAHAGPLLEELLAAECISGYSTAEGKWEFHLGMHAPDERCDTLTQAISRAWLAWKKDDYPND